jgi:hypothetical protein
MLRHTAPKPAAGGRQTGFQSDRLGRAIGSADTIKPQELISPIRATLIGFDRCEAEGRAVPAYAPVLAMCRELLAAGCGRAMPLPYARLRHRWRSQS